MATDPVPGSFPSTRVAKLRRLAVMAGLDPPELWLQLP
jgi:hypothetical protein